MYEQNIADNDTISYYEYFLEKQFRRETKKRFRLASLFKNSLRSIRYFFKFRSWSRRGNISSRKRVMVIQRYDNQYIIDMLKKLKRETNDPVVDRYIDRYELIQSVHKSIGGARTKPEKNNIEEYALIAFQIERDSIQDMFEKGRISRQTANKMRDNIAALERQMN